VTVTATSDDVAVVMFDGDRLPPLKAVRPDRVRPGDVYWGVQAEDNIRKGFVLESEGVPVRGLPRLLEMGVYVSVESRMIRKDRMVLVEDTARLDEMKVLMRRARWYMDKDTGHPAFCEVPNRVVMDLLNTLDRLMVNKEDS
jgi:hypothetical protein